MKKDIEIPKVENVYIAIVNEYDDVYKTYDWNAYIINNKNAELEMVLIVTSGYTENKTTFDVNCIATHAISKQNFERRFY